MRVSLLISALSVCWVADKLPSAPRSALKNVSNSQKASARTPSLAERHKTPTRPSYAGQSTSAKRIKMSIRRQLSKSYGDLSHLRPKSPPIQNPSVGFQGLQLSPGNYVDDVQNLFSPNYNRQGRQTIPSDWRTNRLDQQRPAAAERSTPTSLPTNKSQRFRPISPSDNNKKCRIGSGPITIPIRGLASEFLQPLDFFVTVRRLHPNNEGRKYETLQKHASQAPVVEHVDISTTWIGLEYIDAEELFRIHRSFCKKFDEILARELWHVYHQLQQQDSVGNINPVPSLYTDGIVRGIAFCRNQLHDAMADALYSTVEEIERSQSGLLRLYLAARDCLEQYHEDSSRDASVIIRMRCDQSSPIAYPIVEAAWVPDSLVFENLDEFPCEGREFLVIPRYLSKSAFRPARFPTNVKYSIESQPSLLSWLVWDGRIGGFRGTVPTFSDKMDYTGCYTNRSCKSCGGSIYNKLAFVVRAVLSDDNGSSIGYQKTLRARLTIKVVPWYANDIVHELHPRFPQPKAYQQTKITAADQNFGYMILDSISQKVGLSIRPSSRLKEDTAQQVDDHQSPWKLSRQYLLSNRDLEHTRPNLNAIAVHGSGLAQIHNLASNSVDFGSVKDADKQDMILNTLEDLQAQATHVSSPLVYFTNDRNVLAYRDYHTQFASGSSARVRFSRFDYPQSRQCIES